MYRFVGQCYLYWNRKDDIKMPFSRNYDKLKLRCFVQNNVCFDMQSQSCIQIDNNNKKINLCIDENGKCVQMNSQMQRGLNFECIDSKISIHRILQQASCDTSIQLNCYDSVYQQCVQVSDLYNYQAGKLKNGTCAINAKDYLASDLLFCSSQRCIYQSTNNNIAYKSCYSLGSSYFGIDANLLCLKLGEKTAKVCMKGQYCLSQTSQACQELSASQNSNAFARQKNTQICLSQNQVTQLGDFIEMCVSGYCIQTDKSTGKQFCLQTGKTTNLCIDSEGFCLNISTEVCYQCPKDYCSFSNLNKCLTGQDTIQFIGKGNCAQSINNYGLCRIVSIQISQQNSYDLCSDINGLCQGAAQTQNSCLQCPQQYYYNPGTLKCYSMDEANKEFNQNNTNFIFGLNIEYVQDDCYDNNNCLSDPSKKCPSGCFSCTSSTYCTQCTEGYFLQQFSQNNQQLCVQCPSIYTYFGFLRYVCIDCSSELEFWTKDKIYKNCRSFDVYQSWWSWGFLGFQQLDQYNFSYNITIVNQNQVSIQSQSNCPQNCTSCEFQRDQIICLKCQQNFFLADKTCQACPKDCVTCDYATFKIGSIAVLKSQLTQQQLQSDQYINAKWSVICLSCPSGQLVLYDLSGCTKCSDSCAQCVYQNAFGMLNYQITNLVKFNSDDIKNQNITILCIQCQNNQAIPDQIGSNCVQQLSNCAYSTFQLQNNDKETRLIIQNPLIQFYFSYQTKTQTCVQCQYMYSLQYNQILNYNSCADDNKNYQCNIYYIPQNIMQVYDIKNNICLQSVCSQYIWNCQQCFTYIESNQYIYQCTSCVQPTYIPSINGCISCPQGCATCYEGSKYFNFTYSLIAGSNQFMSFQDRLNYKQGLDYQLICTSCLYGFYLDLYTQKCIKISCGNYCKKCELINNQPTCTQCNYSAFSNLIKDYQYWIARLYQGQYTQLDISKFVAFNQNKTDCMLCPYLCQSCINIQNPSKNILYVYQSQCLSCKNDIPNQSSSIYNYKITYDKSRRKCYLCKQQNQGCHYKKQKLIYARCLEPSSGVGDGSEGSPLNLNMLNYINLDKIILNELEFNQMVVYYNELQIKEINIDIVLLDQQCLQQNDIQFFTQIANSIFSIERLTLNITTSKFLFNQTYLFQQSSIMNIIGFNTISIQGIKFIQQQSNSKFGINIFSNNLTTVYFKGVTFEQILVNQKPNMFYLAFTKIYNLTITFENIVFSQILIQGANSLISIDQTQSQMQTIKFDIQNCTFDQITLQNSSLISFNMQNTYLNTNLLNEAILFQNIATMIQQISFIDIIVSNNQVQNNNYTNNLIYIQNAYYSYFHNLIFMDNLNLSFLETSEIYNVEIDTVQCSLTNTENNSVEMLQISAYNNIVIKNIQIFNIKLRQILIKIGLQYNKNQQTQPIINFVNFTINNITLIASNQATSISCIQIMTNMVTQITLSQIKFQVADFQSLISYSMLDQISIFLSIKAQFSTLSIFNSQFEKLNPFLQAPIFNLKLNSVLFQECEFQFQEFQIQNVPLLNTQKQGGLAYIQSINNHLIKSNFSNAQANIGAALYFQLIEISQVIIQECQFLNNTSLDQSTFESVGGAIYFDATQSRGYDIKIQQTLFYMNFASYRGGALYLQAPHKYGGSLVIINSQFIDNFSLQGGLIFISCQKVDNTKVVLQNINQQSFISHLSKKMLIMQNMLAKYKQYDAAQKSLIQLNSVSYFELLESNLRVIYDMPLEIQNTVLNQFIFQSILIANRVQEFYCFKSTFADSIYGQAMISINKSSYVQFSYSKIQNNKNYQDHLVIKQKVTDDSQNLIFVQSKRINILYSNITDNECKICSQGNVLLDSMILNLRFTNFLRNKAFSGGALYIQNSQQNELQQNSISKDGIYYKRYLQQNYFQNPQNNSFNVNINDCVFQDNLSLKNGGGLYLKFFPSLIAFTKFINNTAKQNGGAIYSDDSTYSLFESFQSIYQENQAQNGGGIYSKSGNSITNFSKNIFQQNMAYHLNNDVYTSPTQMIAKVNNNIYKNQDKQILFSIDNHFSGILNQDAIIYLINNDGAIYTEFENNPLLYLSVIQGKASLSISQISQKKGIFNFTEQVSIYGYFGEKYLLMVTSDSIKIPIGQSQTGQIIYQTNYQKIIEINMIQRCEQGYIPRINNQGYDLCIQCPQGTYSFDPTQPTCQQCPLVEANCYRNVIELPQGYWRSTKNSINIYPCQSFVKCIGDKTPLFKSLAQFKKTQSQVIQYCNRGYIGAICDDCDYNSMYWNTKFYKTSYNSCNQCRESKFINVIIYLVLFLTYVALLCYYSAQISDGIQQMIFLNVLKYINPRLRYLSLIPSLSLWFKLILNYIQIIFYILDIKSNDYGSFYLMNFFECPFIVPIDELSCILNEQIANFQIPFQKLFYYLTGPIILILGCFLVFKTVLAFKNQIQNIYLLWIQTFFIVFYFNIQFLIKNGIQTLSCIVYDGTHYVSYSLSLECTSSYFNQAFIYVSIVTLLSFIPIITAKFLLYKKRYLLTKFENQRQLGFFSITFDQKYYYWDFIILAEKVLLITFSELFRDNDNCKLALMNVVLLSYTFLQRQNKPFFNQYFNTFDSQISNLLVVVCSLKIIILNSPSTLFNDLLLAFISLILFLIAYILDIKRQRVTMSLDKYIGISFDGLCIDINNQQDQPILKCYCTESIKTCISPQNKCIILQDILTYIGIDKMSQKCVSLENVISLNQEISERVDFFCLKKFGSSTKIQKIEPNECRKEDQFCTDMEENTDIIGKKQNGECIIIKKDNYQLLKEKAKKNCVDGCLNVGQNNIEECKSNNNQDTIQGIVDDFICVYQQELILIKFSLKCFSGYCLRKIFNQKNQELASTCLRFGSNIHSLARDFENNCLNLQTQGAHECFLEKNICFDQQSKSCIQIDNSNKQINMCIDHDGKCIQMNLGSSYFGIDANQSLSISQDSNAFARQKNTKSCLSQNQVTQLGDSIEICVSGYCIQTDKSTGKQFCLQTGKTTNLCIDSDGFCLNISTEICYQCPKDYCSFPNLNKCLTGQDTIQFIGQGNCAKITNNYGLCSIISIQIYQQNSYDLCSDINGLCQEVAQTQNSCLQCPQQYYYNPGTLKCYSMDEANKEFNQQNKNYIFGLNIQYVQDDCYDNNNCLSDSSKKCPTGCFSCTSSTYCSQCIEGYFLQQLSKNNQQLCVQCPSIYTYFGDLQYVCIDCSSELEFWTKDQIYKNCRSFDVYQSQQRFLGFQQLDQYNFSYNITFFNQNQVFIQKQSNCPQNCTSCEFQRDQIICLKCKENFFLANQTCQLCPKDCVTCDYATFKIGSIAVLKSQLTQQQLQSDQYIKAKWSVICLSCPSGYLVLYDLSGCTKCSDSCAQCVYQNAFGMLNYQITNLVKFNNDDIKNLNITVICKQCQNYQEIPDQIGSNCVKQLPNCAYSTFELQNDDKQTRLIIQNPLIQFYFSYQNKTQTCVQCKYRYSLQYNIFGNYKSCVNNNTNYQCNIYYIPYKIMQVYDIKNDICLESDCSQYIWNCQQCFTYIESNQQIYQCTSCIQPTYIPSINGCISCPQGCATCYEGSKYLNFTYSLIAGTNIGAALYFQLIELSQVIIQECQFINNTSLDKSTFESFGGAIYFDATQSRGYDIKIQQTLFQMNFASYRGGALYLQAPHKYGGSLAIINSQFIDNFSLQGGLIFISCQKVDNTKVVLQNINQQSFISHLSKKMLIMQNMLAQYKKYDVTQKSLIQLNSVSYFELLESTLRVIYDMPLEIQNTVLNQFIFQSILIANKVQEFYCFKSTFADSIYGQAMISINQSSYVQFSYSRIQNNKNYQEYLVLKQKRADDSKNLVFVQSNRINILYSNITDNECKICSQGNVLLDSMIINLRFTNFLRNKAFSGGALYIQNSQQNELQQNSISKDGVYYKRYLQQNYFQKLWYNSYNININDCVFQDNLSLKNGGGLYLKSFPTLIAFTKFINNTAKYNGGAIYSYDSINSLFESFQSLYYVNQAQNGGGIYSKSGNSIINFQKNIFQYNKAYLLNNNVYTSPTQIIARVNNHIYKNQDKQILFSIDNHFSGILNQEVIIYLINNDGAIYTEFENNPLLYLSVIQGKASLSISQISQKKGKFNFTEQVSIYGYFGEKYLLMVTSDSIKIPTGQSQTGQIIYQTNYQRIIEINMIEKCNQGYIPRKNSQGYDLCIQCPQGTYSFDPTQSICQQCPLVEANCYGNVIELPQGYWRSTKDSINIYPCQSFVKCIGDKASFFKSLDQFKKTQSQVIQYCNRGYIGAICDDCDYNSMYWNTKFYKTSYNSCNQCRENNFMNIIIYFVLFLTYVTLLCYYSAQILDGIQQELFLNVLKFINPRLRSLSLIPSLSLWLKLILNYIQIIFYVLDIKSNDYGSFYLINFFECPFIVPIDELSLFYFNIQFFIKNGIQTLSCVDYDGTYYVSYNLSLQCTSSYINQAFIYVCIVFLLSFIPIVAAKFLLYKKRYLLTQFENKRQLGFFSIIFDQKYYYWDFIILAEKVLLITFSELFRDNENCKLALMNVVLLSYTFLQRQHKPFFNQYFNTFDSQISNLLLNSVNYWINQIKKKNKIKNNNNNNNNNNNDCYTLPSV
ncbi:hypothetical protein ABPG74_008832 [Tetrahymena malaccensis]